MLRWLITGFTATLALSGLGGWWIMRSAEESMETAARELLHGASADYDQIEVLSSGQTLTITGHTKEPEHRKHAEELLRKSIKLRVPFVGMLNPVREVIPGWAMDDTAAPAIPSLTKNSTEAQPSEHRPHDGSWLLLCVSGAKSRLSGALADPAMATELTKKIATTRPDVGVANLVVIDPQTTPIANSARTVADMPIPSTPEQEVIAATKGDGIWINLPLNADELTVAQALSGVHANHFEISKAILDWRQPIAKSHSTVGASPRPASPPPPSSQPNSTTPAAVVAPKSTTDTQATPAQPLPPSRVLPRARVVGPSYIGWAISSSEVTMFGAVLSESQKTQLFEAAQKLFAPKVISVTHVSVDASRTKRDDQPLRLPSKLPQLPLGVAVAGQPIKTYPASTLDGQLVADHRKYGLTAGEVSSALLVFRHSLIKAGVAKPTDCYLTVMSDGKRVTISGEVTDSATQKAAIAVVQAGAVGLQIDNRLTCSPLVSGDAGIITALKLMRQTVLREPGTVCLRPGQIARRGLIHCVYFATGASHSIDEERAARQVALATQQFSAAKFEVVGHTDNTGTAANNIKLSEQRAQTIALYLATETGLPVERFAVRGAGPSEPIADNATDQGRSMNRRVDVKLILE